MKSNTYLIEFSDYKNKKLIHLTQWDKGQVFEFSETFANGTEVQFDNGMTKVISNKKVAIPDAVLMTSGTRKAWIQVITSADETTIYEIIFMVDPRTKQNDYVEPDDEQSFREEVQSMVNAKQDKLTAGANITIENNVISASGSGGGGGTSDYTALTNKPKINNITLSGNKSLSDLGITNFDGNYNSLTNKPTIPSKTSDLTNDSNFVTNSYHDSAKQDVISDLSTIRSGASLGATALQSVPDTYAKKTDIPSLNGYATESWVESKGYLTSHQDISGKANVGDSYTKAESDAKYLTSHQDLSAYALKSEIPSVPTNISSFTNDSGYLTLATLPKYDGGVE